jgi:PPOX class probable F420-dependent enzyme
VKENPVAKQRDAIQMTEAEVLAFLEESRSLNVATLDKTGAPHLTTLWFARHEGNLIFETYGSSQKVVNLRRDPRVAALCEAGETYDQLRGVSIQGRAEIVASGPRLDQLMGVLIAHNFPDADAARLAEMVAQMTRKRVVVVIHPEKIFSWDHRKLTGAATKPA